MMERASRKKVFTVVAVWRGFAAEAKTFARLANARRFEAVLRRKYRADGEDDVRLFESRLR